MMGTFFDRNCSAQDWPWDSESEVRQTLSWTGWPSTPPRWALTNFTAACPATVPSGYDGTPPTAFMNPMVIGALPEAAPVVPPVYLVKRAAAPARPDPPDGLPPVVVEEAPPVVVDEPAPVVVDEAPPVVVDEPAPVEEWELLPQAANPATATAKAPARRVRNFLVFNVFSCSWQQAAFPLPFCPPESTFCQGYRSVRDAVNRTHPYFANDDRARQAGRTEGCRLGSPVWCRARWKTPRRSTQWIIISGLTMPHLLAARRLGSQTFGPCGQVSCQGRGANSPVSSSAMRSSSVKSSMMLPSGSRW